ncbi:hypothetical protein [Gracilimonas tropica]|uniref:hypothetical protein n=1 Tax=Gracilimonas tropica TaxID=454600 RepID=UPI00037F2A62|nr:hypothetical protein [Gracilimonas tropica]
MKIPIAERNILISNSYDSATDFLKKCGINNYSLITDLKNECIKKSRSEVLARIVIGTGCNGTWLLTGEGEPFEKGVKDLSKRERAELALKEILDYQFDESEEGMKEASDIQIKLAETLTDFLKNRGN